MLLFAILVLLSFATVQVGASAGLFTYYEDPFLPSPDNPNLVFELGPARWRNLNLANNQCGGNGRKCRGIFLYVSCPYDAHKLTPLISLLLPSQR